MTRKRKAAAKIPEERKETVIVKRKSSKRKHKIPRFVRGTVRIATGTEEKPVYLLVKGYILSEFLSVTTEGHGKHWAVTHIPTGKAVTTRRFSTVTRAKEAAIEMCKLDLPWENLGNDSKANSQIIGENKREKLYAVINSFADA